MIASWLSKGLFLTLLFASSPSISAQQASVNDASKQACEIGMMVQALQVAIRTPQEQKSLQIIYDYATDSRYYVMIRGWLFEELVGVESQLHASHNAKEIARLQLKSDSLKRAIRTIDLE